MPVSMLGFFLPMTLPVWIFTFARSEERIEYLGMPDGVIHIQSLHLTLWFPETEVVSPARYRSLTHDSSSSFGLKPRIYLTYLIIRHQLNVMPFSQDVCSSAPSSENQ